MQRKQRCSQRSLCAVLLCCAAHVGSRAIPSSPSPHTWWKNTAPGSSGTGGAGLQRQAHAGAADPGSVLQPNDTFQDFLCCNQQDRTENTKRSCDAPKAPGAHQTRSRPAIITHASSNHAVRLLRIILLDSQSKLRLNSFLGQFTAAPCLPSHQQSSSPIKGLLKTKQHSQQTHAGE